MMRILALPIYVFAMERRLKSLDGRKTLKAFFRHKPVTKTLTSGQDQIVQA